MSGIAKLTCAGLDTNPAEPPAAVTLEGRFARIEKLDAVRHADDLWKEFGDDRIWTYMSYGPFADFHTFSSWLGERAALADPFYFAVIDRMTGRALGVVTLMEIRRAHRVIEVGHVVYGPSLQRSRLATEAQYLLARYAFEALRYRRYEWKCNSLNTASRRAAERLGFTFEGIFRQHMIVKGNNRDTAWYAMLDNNWPRVRAAFEAWLDVANFDEEGRQRRRLEEIRRPSAS